MPDHQIQLTLDHSPSQVFAALTDARDLENWFAEHANVSLSESRYDFWGRFTPLTPIQADGAHPILEANPAESLVYIWPMQGSESTVAFRLYAVEQGTRLVLQHAGIPKGFPVWMEDYWFIALENFRRYLDGKKVVRLDFAKLKTGNYSHTVEIKGPAEAVFEALTVPEQMNRWIAADAKVEPVEGGLYTYGWQGVEPAKILEIIPNQKLTHTWGAWADQPATTVTWTLEESGGKTRLTLTHSGFAPDHPIGGEQIGWLNFMNWIKSLVEYGAKWIPPTTRVAEGMEGYYPSSIVVAQGTLVTTISVRKD